jgi:type II secretory pathway component PulJ
LAQVFHARANDIAPDVFAREIAIPAAQYYNDAILAIESNGESGATAVQSCRDGYRNLYMQTNYQKASATYTDKYGWNTNEQSRYRMIDALKRALEENRWTPTRDLLEEMGHMVVKSVGAKSKVEHADGYHDDLAMAAGGALAIHFEEPLVEWPDFSRLRIKFGPDRITQELSFS